MPPEFITFLLKIKNEKIKKEFEETIASIPGFQIQNPGSPSSLDLLILEIGDDLKKEFELIHSFQTSGIVREIFLTSSRLDPDFLIQAIRAGAKEFFPQPIKRDEVKGALLKLKERKASAVFSEKKRKRGEIINVIGSKGGVGTTTVAVNLATSLMDSKGSPSVALIDMNLLFGEIPLFLNVESAFNWGEVARNISRLDSTYLMSILSKHPSGIYILPSPTGLDGVNIATPEMIEKLLGLMQTVFDFIVIDGGQSLDDISLKILQMSDNVFLVTILSLPCLTNVKRLLWTFQKLGYPQEENIKILISRYHKNSVISLKEAEQSIKKSIFWLIPNDYTTTMSAINQGKTISSIAHGSEISKNLRELTSVFLETAEKKKERVRFETN